MITTEVLSISFIRIFLYNKYKCINQEVIQNAI